MCRECLELDAREREQDRQAELEESRVKQVAQLEPGERFTVDGFGQGFCIRQEPERGPGGSTLVLLETDTVNRAVMYLPSEGWEVQVGFGKDRRLEKYQDALSYGELEQALRDKEQELIRYEKAVIARLKELDI